MKIWVNRKRKRIENPDVIVDIVELILAFNNQQRGQELKLLAPDQMLSRLPISLAQLKTGNNSEKLKNQIRQLLYSLYKSKKTYKISFVKVWLSSLKDGNKFYEQEK